MPIQIPWPWTALEQQANTDTAAIRADIAAVSAKIDALASKVDMLIKEFSVTSISLDFAHVERRSQPVPTKPGP